MNRKILALLAAAVFVSSAGRAAQTGTPAKTAPSKGTSSKPASAEKAKQHQATGAVVSFTDTRLVISKATGKNKSDWPFALSPQTKIQGKLAKGARVTVYYHEEKTQRIAHRVKVLEASKTTAKSGAKSSKPTSPK